MSNLIDQKELMEWTGYKCPNSLRRFLDSEGIAYRFGKGKRICTTQAAIDKVLINDRREEIEFA